MGETKFKSMSEAEEIVKLLAHDDLYTHVGDVNLGMGRSATNQPVFNVTVDGKEMALENSAVRDLLPQLGVPRGAMKEYADNPKLLDEMIGYSRDRRKANPVRLVLSKGKIIHIQKGTDIALTLTDVWSAIKDLDDVVGIHQISRVGDHFQVRAVCGETKSPPRNVGDISHSGVCVSFNGSVDVKPYVYRLDCTNGLQVATDTATMETEKQDTKPAYMEKFRTLLDFAFLASKQALTRFVDSDEEIIDNPTAYIIRLMSMYGISDAHMGKIVKRMGEEVPRGTLYELTNLITSYARDLKSHSMRDKFEVFGATVCNRSTRCSKCNSGL